MKREELREDGDGIRPEALGGVAVVAVEPEQRPNAKRDIMFDPFLICFSLADAYEWLLN